MADFSVELTGVKNNGTTIVFYFGKIGGIFRTGNIRELQTFAGLARFTVAMPLFITIMGRASAGEFDSLGNVIDLLPEEGGPPAKKKGGSKKKRKSRKSKKIKTLY